MTVVISALSRANLGPGARELGSSLREGALFSRALRSLTCALLFSIAGLLWPDYARALSIMFPGEGLKTVVSAAGDVVSTALNADNQISRGAKRAVAAVSPNEWAAHFDQFDMSLTGTAYRNIVNGDTSRSFLPVGTWTQETLNVGIKKRLAAFKGSELEVQSSLRNTDDRQVDKEKNMRLTGFFGALRRPNDFELRGGNVSGNFSPYSLSASADLGAQATKFLGGERKSGEFQLYFGRPTQGVDGKSFERHVYGARLAGFKGSEKSILDGLGLNAVRTRDDTASISNPAARPANAVDNQVISVDGGLKLGKAVSLKSEAAYSSTDPDTQSAAASFEHGAAFKAAGSYRAPNWRAIEAGNLTASFEQVDPNYRSTSGGGSPDGQRAALGAAGGIVLPGSLPKVSATYSGNTSHNDLRHQLARRNTSTVHNVNFGFNPFEKLAGTGAGDKNGGFWASAAKNMKAGVGFSHTDSDTSDHSAASVVRGQNYTLSTSAGRQTLSTNFSRQRTEEKTAATGDRENRVVGLTYAYQQLSWRIPAAKPVSSDLSVSLSQTRDRTLDAPGGSLQRQMRLGAQTKVNDTERMDLEYELAFTGNDTANSDVRTENWKVAYAISKFIMEDGTLSLSYTSKRTLEADRSRNYGEQVVRGDLALKWGGKPTAPKVTQNDAEKAVKAVLNAYASRDAVKLLKLVSPNFKGDRAVFETQFRDAFNRADSIQYEGVSVRSFVPGRDTLEVTFSWQRRVRLHATGAEETATGVGLFRLERSGDQWLLLEIRKESPLL